MKYKTYFYPNLIGHRWSTFTGSEETRIKLGCKIEATEELVKGLKDKTLIWTEDGRLVSYEKE